MSLYSQQLQDVFSVHPLSVTSLSSLLLVCLNPTDPTLTVENIGPVMEAVGNWQLLATSFNIPSAIRERITHLHTTDKEQSCAAGEWWLCTHTFPSWNDLARALYRNREDRTLEKMAHYLPRGMYMERVSVLFTVVVSISIDSAPSVSLSEDNLSSHVLYTLIPGPQ